MGAPEGDEGHFITDFGAEKVVMLSYRERAL
jgi:hypothetical protein